jgi:hypothetical protein
LLVLLFAAAVRWCRCIILWYLWLGWFAKCWGSWLVCGSACVLWLNMTGASCSVMIGAGLSWLVVEAMGATAQLRPGTALLCIEVLEDRPVLLRSEALEPVEDSGCGESAPSGGLAGSRKSDD